MTEEISGVIFGVWFLIGAALVFWMQAGFAMVEAGFTRAKNTGNILMKNLMDFCIGTVVFILIGFSLLLGEDVLGFIGKPGFDIFTSTKILTGQTLYSTWFSVRQQQLSYQELWLREQNLFPIVFIQELFQHLFTQSRLTGSGAVAGFHRLASMISQVHVPSTWLVVSVLL